MSRVELLPDEQATSAEPLAEDARALRDALERAGGAVPAVTASARGDDGRGLVTVSAAPGDGEPEVSGSTRPPPNAWSSGGSRTSTWTTWCPRATSTSSG